MPRFWKETSGIWFVQVETAFDLYRIAGDTTKCRYVVLQFDQTVILYVSDIVAKPPQKDKYKTVKDRIFTSFAAQTIVAWHRLPG